MSAPAGDAGQAGREPERARPLRVAGFIATALVVILLITLLVSRIQTAATQVHVAANDRTHAGATAVTSAMGVSLVGRFAPDVTFSAWTVKPGQQVALSSLRGHPVVLNFWEASCYPCTLEAPLFAQANKTYQAQGVIFVGVAFSTSQAEGDTFLRQYGLTYLAGGAITNQTVVDYSLVGYPDTYFIDRDGKIVDQHVGQITQQTLDEGVKAALK